MVPKSEFSSRPNHSSTIVVPSSPCQGSRDMILMNSGLTLAAWKILIIPSIINRILTLLCFPPTVLHRLISHVRRPCDQLEI
mmetsp:Transcript_14091/g.28838  ORF Transcript_14091/g.28838 Transcript_14091/m.28838 type:complete len:82 (-) Transcript_14091:30-275(-)